MITRLFKRALLTSTKAVRTIDVLLSKGYRRLFIRLHSIRYTGGYTTKFYKKFVKFHYRAVTAVLLFLMIFAAVAPVIQQHLEDKQYVINASAAKLLGKANSNLTKKLTYDAQKQLYQFNKDAIKTGMPTNNPYASMQSKIGGGGAKDDQLYSVDAPEDLSKGVTYYDNQSQLNFKITPQFGTMKGRQVNGHLIYPMSGAGAEGQVAYTLDPGGLKENVILYKSPGNTHKMSYSLDLPKSLEAKLQQDGSVGIYSADPSLFGNITYGSSDDQAKIERARNQGTKNHLTFTIPAPIVTGLNGGSQSTVSSVRSSFALEDNVLTVTTTDLDKATYPLAIDPTIAIDSTSDFQSGNMEGGNNDIDNGSLNRGALTGGSVGSYTTNSSPLPTAQGGGGTVVYNGYVYVVGGNNGSGNTAAINYASFSGSGSTSGWTTSPISMSSTRIYHSVAAYNGYLYVLGGSTDGTNMVTTVEYIKLNSNGSLSGSWKTANSLNTARYSGAASVYNGYIYINGGCSVGSIISCGTRTTDVQYAAINADGSLGSWQATTSLSGGRWRHSSVVYNQFMYVLGGEDSGVLNTVQYAPINANGSLGAWSSTTAFTSGRTEAAAFVNNGYMYILGGNLGTGSLAADTQYAQINANGTLASWSATNSFGTPRARFGAVAYKGYVYAVGGCTNTTCSSYTSDVQYAKISVAGVTTGSIAATSLPSGLTKAGAVAHGGFLYVIGGADGSGVKRNTVQSVPINANGTLGATWNTSLNPINTGRINFGIATYNGYIYVVGGDTGSDTNDIQYARMNADGTIGSWSSTGNAFSQTRRELTAVALNGFLYIIGGYGNTGSGFFSLNNVGHVALNPDGSVGSYVNDTVLPTGVNEASIAESNGYIYVVGGYNGGLRNTVQIAKPNADGTITNWTTSAHGIATARQSMSLTAFNGYLYMSGGSNGGSTYYSDTQMTRVNGDGSINPWTTTSSLSSLRANLASAQYGNKIYSIGGTNTTAALATNEYSMVENGGSGLVTSWAASSNTFTTARAHHGAAAYNGYLYVMGGCSVGSGTCTSYLNDTQYAKINGDGTIGTWSTAVATGFANPRATFATAIYNGYLYVIGGVNGSVSYTDTQYAKINSNGTLGAWATNSTTFVGRYGHAAAVSNGYLYTLGGVVAGNGSGDVQYAQIYADGSLGSWAATNALTVRIYAGAVAYNGYIYVIGGCGANNIFGCVANLNEVKYAKINADGTLGSWDTTNAIAYGRYHPTVSAENGYIYMSGGYTSDAGGQYLADVQRAPMYSNGSVGAWTRTAALPSARATHAAVLYNGYLYVTGGLNSSGTFLSETLIGGVDSIARRTTYSKLVNLGVPSNIASLSFAGVLPGGITNLRYRMAGSNNIFGAYKSGSTGACSELDTASLIQIFVTIDDSQTGAFNDTANATNNGRLDSITVNAKAYVPPASRLRHGAQFTNEVQQAFQTDTAVCT